MTPYLSSGIKLKRGKKNKSSKRRGTTGTKSVKPDTAEPNSAECIPEKFLERVTQVISDKFIAQALRSFQEPKDAAFRVNPLAQIDPAEVVKELSEQLVDLKPVEWFENAFSVGHDSRDKLVNSLAAENSQIYIQNPSSFLPCLVLNPQPGEQVLDLCAAPGGKTLLLAAMMKNEGLVSAVEAVRGRYFKLQANLKRYGCEIARTYLSDGRSVGRKVPERFDRVLIDAPCSGETRIHQLNPESFEFWSERKVKEQSRKQYGLIRSGFEALRPGGKLVYCTCSFAPEENEKVVSDFLIDQPKAELTEIEIPKGVDFEPGLTQWNEKEMHAEVSKTVRIVPGRLMNGFFIAAIRKKVE